MSRLHEAKSVTRPAMQLDRTIVIDASGKIRYLNRGEGEAMKLDKLSVARGISQVHPTSTWLRVAFYVLRYCFGQRSQMSDWTREWKCRWSIKLKVSGGTIGRCYSVRADGITTEEAWQAEAMASRSYTQNN